MINKWLLIISVFVLCLGCSPAKIIPIATYDQPGSALMIIDMQKDFLTPGGRMPVDGNQALEIIETANQLIDQAAIKGWEVICIGNEFKKNDWLNMFRNQAAVERSEGAAWDDRVSLDHSRYFPKWSTDAFTNPSLDAYLRDKKINQLYVMGLYAEHCVFATASGALSRNYQVTVISDGLASTSDRNRKKAFNKYQKHHITLISKKELLN